MMKRKSIFTFVLIFLMLSATVPAQAAITHKIMQADDVTVKNIKDNETIYMPFTLKQRSRAYLYMEIEEDSIKYANKKISEFTVTLQKKIHSRWKDMGKRYSFKVEQDVFEDSFFSGHGSYGLTKGSYRFVYTPNYPQVSTEYGINPFANYKTTMKKAKRIKKNECVTSLVTESDKKPQWYKFNLKNTTKTYVGLDGIISESGKIRMEIYNDKGKKIWNGTYKEGQDKMFCIKRLAKGTYYVSINKVNKTTNGQIYFEWNDRN